MATRTKSPQRGAQLAFEALSIEGGLLSPDWLARVAQLHAGSQGETDYRILKGLSLRDEIGRYWRIAQAHWNDFAGGRASATDQKALAERFVLGLLRDSFGFVSLAAVIPIEIDERTYPIGFCALGQRVPVVIAAADAGVDAPAASFGDQHRKRSAFGLAQEFLNAADGAMWGIATDGAVLRILRDNASLTRPAWIEADLDRIFREQRYADFAALWLLVHETRFGEVDQPVAECALETWRTAGREQGTRAREHLRTGVEDALIALGQGFLAHADNRALRAALADGSLTTTAYFQQLLRLVYRIIFVLTAEERGLLHPTDAVEPAKYLYAQGYSLHRLRDRAVKRSAHDRHSDLWEVVKIVFGGLALSEARLGLPALAGIFAKGECPALDTAKLENRALMMAMFRLTWLREKSGLSRVNWRDMGPEELGSVYESLLELVPQIVESGRKFAFATGGETKGNARKTSGSYYTPESLVHVLLDSALEPVIVDTIAKNPSNPIDALLGLSIVDPACGSGHFLLAAARRLAGHVARLQANGTPSASEYRHALRQVIGHCIYGVDLNPLAVELCKVSLWMEALEPGLPLTFLNSHIQRGNALLGTTPELMKDGIPDKAWEPIEGDDKKVASALKKRNKKAESGQRGFAFEPTEAEREAETITREVAALDAASDSNLTALANKETKWRTIRESQAFQHQRLVADAWCAAFVWPKQPGALSDAAPTNELWRQLRDGQGQPLLLTVNTVKELTEQYNFFHWHLAFPQVFAKGGFDVVLGNPPWERVKIQEQEFFASRSDEIAQAVNAAARKKLIAKLPEEIPQLWAEWCTASRKAEGESHSIRQSGRYPLCGKGDVNTYAIFAEHNRAVRRPSGRAGFIVPAGLVTDETTKDYFADIVQRRGLASVYHFENEEKLFPTVHNAFRFILLTLGDAPRADLVFFARQVSALAENERHVSLTAADFAVLNPNTRTCPTFRSRRDADLNLGMYARGGVLDSELLEQAAQDATGWHVEVCTKLFDMADDSALFLPQSEIHAEHEYAPLFEAKMAWHFDHRFATYEGATQANRNKGTLPQLTDAQHADAWHRATPEYWVTASEVEERLRGRWSRGWLLGWRDITGTEKQRTVIASLIPRAAVGHTMRLMFVNMSAPLVAALYANLCSFPLDYAARQKVGGTHLTWGAIRQLPVLSPAIYQGNSEGVPMLDWLLPRVLELTYTAWDLEPFAHDVGYDGPPFRWDPARRFLLRCELDAAFFHLYGLSRDDTDYVMDTFPIVRKNDEKAHGEYRTKRVILEIYDAMAEAAHTGVAYQTRLDPPAADPSRAHVDTRGAEVIKLPTRKPVTPSWPAWDPEVLPAVASAVGVPMEAGGWATSLEGQSLGLNALAAVLRRYPGPRSRAEVENAVVLALLPQFIGAKLPGKAATQWRHLLSDAQASLNSIADLHIPWNQVILAAQQQHILRVEGDGRWSAGADVGDAPNVVLDARAMVACAWLATAPTSDAAVEQQAGVLSAA